MIATILIAIASGAASALMFASVKSGALISLVLFNLAPLPLMVAAIGWGPLTAAIGSIAATAMFGLLFGFPFAFAFASTAALPAWWLGHLALLGRPAAPASSGNGAAPPASAMEWYPTGRLLLWMTGITALLAFVTLLSIGSDAESIAAAMKKGFARMVRLFAARGVAVDDDIIDKMAALAPAGVPTGPLIVMTVNLWLAGKIAVTSGRLHRSWPDLKSTALPPMTLVALCVALAFCFTGGLLAVLAKVIAGALLTAYALTGFAVLHTLTLAVSNRALWLVLTYAVVAVLMWPLLAMAALGVADALFGFRERYMRKRPPPLPAA
ncbi:hypothetical protein [Bradyrhizobium sp.]|uniref:hypothetical protein n=1 Tax=Bradyrhizobium sp. TaxID=376 RepID=UPI004037FDF9